MAIRGKDNPTVQIKKRSIAIAGHRTSISLEEPFWALLSKMAAQDKVSIAIFVERIDSTRQGGNLSSAIRIHLLERLMVLATLEDKAEATKP